MMIYLKLCLSKSGVPTRPALFEKWAHGPEAQEILGHTLLNTKGDSNVGRGHNLLNDKIKQ